MTDSESIKKDVNRGIAWIGLAASFVSLLDVLATVLILALWISPTEYGIAALAITLFPVLDLAAELGLPSALIQRDDHTEARISTVFWINTFMSVALFGLIGGVLGPLLGWLHGQPIVGLLLTAYGGKLIWQNVYQVPKSLMQRELRFGEIALVRSIANVIEFAAKVGAAAAGAGVWCFVIGPLAREIGWGLGIQACNPWRPKLLLKIRETKAWLWFGVRMSASRMLYQLYSNVDYQIVGHFFGPAANGFYRLAYELVLKPCQILAHIVNQVAFPAYSRLKNRRPELIEQFVSLTKLNLVVVLGFIAVVGVSAPEIIELLWGEKWLPAATAARILCAVGVLRALSYLIPPLLEAMGYPGRSLAYNSVAAVVMPTFFVLAAILLGPSIGYVSVAIAWAVGYPIAFAVLAALALDLLDLTARIYLRRIRGIVLCAVLAVAIGLAVHWAVAPLRPGLAVALTALATGATFFSSLKVFLNLGLASVIAALRGDGGNSGTGDKSEATDDSKGS